MKKITSILLVVLLVLTCLTMAACDPTNPSGPSDSFDTAGAREKLDLYIFEQEGQVISGEFVLPGTIGGFDATWTSSSEFVVLTEVAADEDNGIERQYTVKVGYPEAVTEVELTVALSSDVTKTFKVLVNPLTVHDFIEAYSFLQDKGTVVADFALDRTVDFAGETATIAWSVDEAYTDYIEISEDGNTCVVYPTSLNPTVRIKATFTYEGESATKSYRMTVSEVKDHLQAVDYWYANTGVGMEMKGYVVEIATVYAPSYGNISLYIVDEDFCAGYYLYRVKCDQATADRLVPGAPVVVTGTTNTNYNGLIETNAGGTITIDDSREALTELPVYALDEEVVGGLFSANYHQSTLVSLTNWKVKEVKEAPAAGATSTLFVLEKGGVEVAVAVSKYMEGAYLTKEDDAVWSALAAHGIQVGDIVSVTGVLGNYKGHQIMPLSIDSIVKGDTESTYTAGVTAAAAVKAIDKALADNGLNAMVAVEKNVALPTVEGATITAKVLGASRAVSVVDGAIVVAPGKLENACVQIDVTVGEFKTSIFRYIQSADLDDAEKLEMEAATFDIDVTETIKADTVLNLPATGSIFGAINVAWAFKADTAHDCATLDGNALTITLLDEEATLTLVATLSLGEATPVTKEFTINVASAQKDWKNVEFAVTECAKLDGATKEISAEEYYFYGIIGSTPTADYCNFDLVDENGNKILVYGLYAPNGTDRYGTKRQIAEIPFKEGDLICMRGKLQNYNGKLEIINAVEVVTPEKGSAICNPYTATDAMTECAKLDGTSKEISEKEFYFLGTVHDIYNTQYCNFHFVDDAEGDLIVYGLYAPNGTDRYGSNREIAEIPFAEGDTILLRGKLQNYNGTLQISSAVLISFSTPAGGETPDPTPDPVEKVTTIEAALAATEGTEAELSGTVSEIYEAWSSYNNMSFYITDGTNKILVFRTKTQVNLGDVVSVVGTVTIYNSTAQIAQGSTVTVTQAATPVEPTKVITIADALKATVGAEAELEGTVVGLGTWNTQYNNWDVYVSDGKNEILVYRCTNSELGIGDVVSVVGTIGVYNNVNQIAQGSTVTVVTEHVCSFDPADCDTPATCPVCKATEGEALGHTDEADSNGVCDRCQVSMNAELSKVATFDFGDKVNPTTHVDGNDIGTDKTYTDGNYTLVLSNASKVYDGANDAQGNKCLKFGTSSKVGTVDIAVPEGVDYIYIYVAGYKAKTVTVVVDGESYPLTNKSDEGDYICIKVDVRGKSTITFATSTGYRCMVDAIEYYAY